MAKKPITISNTGLTLLEDCPRCFWLQYRQGIRRPEGPVSRLANRYDSVIKKYFDLYRAISELPPMVEGSLRGSLYPNFGIDRTKAGYIPSRLYADLAPGYKLVGILDELLIDGDRRFSPVDHKTSSAAPVGEPPVYPSYTRQLDIYDYLLGENGHATNGIGYLIFFRLGERARQDHEFQHVVTVKRFDTDASRPKPLLEQAVEILKGSLPEASPACGFCTYFRARQDVAVS
ncbi:MAG: PD-(D/E)XK nuclease family protein [Candidatus Kerfeldbacteria bacterium]|nr:PD-(D/E)XK nuclease family protein [Candidatus Kerfeldbacteria bacterium]